MFSNVPGTSLGRSVLSSDGASRSLLRAARIMWANSWRSSGRQLTFFPESRSLTSRNQDNRLTVLVLDREMILGGAGTSHDIINVPKPDYIDDIPLYVREQILLSSLQASVE